MVSAVSSFEFGLNNIFALHRVWTRLRSKVKAQLQHLCAKLAEVCPSVIQVKDYFLPSHCIFIEILGGIQTVHRVDQIILRIFLPMSLELGYDQFFFLI